MAKSLILENMWGLQVSNSFQMKWLRSRKPSTASQDISLQRKNNRINVLNPRDWQLAAKSISNATDVSTHATNTLLTEKLKWDALYAQLIATLFLWKTATGKSDFQWEISISRIKTWSIAVSNCYRRWNMTLPVFLKTKPMQSNDHQEVDEQTSHQ